MSDVLYIAALLLMFVGLFTAMQQRNKFRDRAHEAEFTVSLQKTEISYLSDENHRLTGLVAAYTEKPNG